MGNDLVRALVELITNSDDAYTRIGRKGPIQIEAEHRRATSGTFNHVVVRDQAGGMSPDEVELGLLVAGGRTSGHELGHRTRGLQGRGAKDIAIFGKATFQTIKDSTYSAVTIDGDTFDYVDRSQRVASTRDYTNLGLLPGSSGTEATIFVRRSAHSVPLHKNLAERLERNFQLRDIMTSQRTEVTLLDLGKNLLPQRLTYEPPYFSEVVLDEVIAVPEYPTSCHLVLRRSEKPYEDDRSASRHSGILIVGRRGIYDATYFGFEGRPGALWFTGRLECDYIDQLQDEYDDARDPALTETARHPRTVPERLNGVPLITRRRDGLEKNHPFAQQLRAIVEEKLRPLIEAEEKAQSQKSGGASADTQRRLHSAASRLGALYQELARQQEVDVADEGGPSDNVSVPVSLAIIPDAATLTPDEVKTFSIFAWPECHEEGAVADPPIATVRSALPEIATVASSHVALTPDRREPRRLRGTFRVAAQDRLDATTIEVTLGTYSAQAIVEVVEVGDPLPVNPPERLLFRQDAYTMRVARRRRLILWAPNQLVERVQADGSSLSPAVFKNTAALTCSDTGPFEEVETDDGHTWYQAEIEVEGTETCVAKVRAEFGGQLAITRVSVTDPESQNPFDFDLDKRGLEYETAGRAQWTTVTGRRKLIIYAGCPSLRRYFGADLEHQDDVVCRVLIAEVLADELAMDLLKREEGKTAGTQLFPDLHSLDARRRMYASKFLEAAHEVLVPDVGND
jgi:hypothetical protein